VTPRRFTPLSARGLRDQLGIHPPVSLVVAASRDACLGTLASAARPSTDRLHLRDLFRDGRRYHLQARPEGFSLYTDTRRLWSSSAGRTSPAATLQGDMAAAGVSDAPITLIRLRARVRPAHVITTLAFPLFVAVLVLASPFELQWKLLLVTGLIGLAALTQRFEAAYQAHAMVEFVRKALDDLPQVHTPQLDPGRGDVVDADAGFSQAWQRFYAEQTGRERED
jgi:hypothetical protein